MASGKTAQLCFWPLFRRQKRKICARQAGRACRRQQKPLQKPKPLGLMPAAARAFLSLFGLKQRRKSALRPKRRQARQSAAAGSLPPAGARAGRGNAI